MKTNPKRLSMNKETLRTISASGLDRVGGGLTTKCSIVLPSPISITSRAVTFDSVYGCVSV